MTVLYYLPKGFFGIVSTDLGGIEVQGKRIINLVERVIDGSVSIREALLFIGWRFGISNEILRIGGVNFKDVDLTLWRIIDTIFIGHEYNPPGFELHSNDIVVDIGAHRGVFVGYAACHTQGQILAIEPDAENFQHLCEFVAVNAIPNTDLINVAVSNERGQAQFYRSNISSRHSLIGFDQKLGDRLERTALVETVTLDDILTRFNTVDFLKMDCEGAEYSILGATGAHTLNKIRRLVVELHGMHEDGKTSSIYEKLANYFNDISIRRLSSRLGLLFAKNNKYS